MKKAFTFVEFLVVIGILGILVGVGATAVSREINKNRQPQVQRSKSDFAKLFNTCEKGPVRTGKKYVIHVDRTRFPQMPETVTAFDAQMAGPNWCKFWLEDGTEVETSLSNLIVTGKEEK